LRGLELEALLEAAVAGRSKRGAHNCGGQLDHKLFLGSLRRPAQGEQPSPELLTSDRSRFRSFERSRPVSSGGAGASLRLVWLIVNPKGTLECEAPPTQDNPPLMDLPEGRGTPSARTMFWEQRYYLQLPEPPAPTISTPGGRW